MNHGDPPDFGVARRVSGLPQPRCKGRSIPVWSVDGNLRSRAAQLANRSGQRRSIGARTAFPGATPSIARAFATTDTPFTITC